MPFFQVRQPQLSPEAAFFSLLSELDQPQQKSCAPRQARQQTFTPRFDVAEVADSYELYGELPGLEQKDISIEFSDAQTLTIKGTTERPTATKTIQPGPTLVESEKAHNPTVEDEYDEADTPLATSATIATTENDAAPAEKQQPAEDKPKFWVAERRVGEFARNFTFSQRVEHDAVKAILKNGILHVVVPKSQKSGKVTVSVF